MSLLHLLSCSATLEDGETCMLISVPDLLCCHMTRTNIWVAYLPHSQQLGWINIPLYRPVILRPLFVRRASFSAVCHTLFTLLSSLPLSPFAVPSALTHHTQLKMRQNCTLYLEYAPEQRERGCARGCQQWYQVQGREKGVGCNYTGLLLQTGVGGGGSFPFFKWRTSISISKQSISAVRHYRGRDIRLVWEKS